MIHDVFAKLFNDCFLFIIDSLTSPFKTNWYENEAKSFESRFENDIRSYPWITESLLVHIFRIKTNEFCNYKNEVDKFISGTYWKKIKLYYVLKILLEIYFNKYYV